MLLNSKCPPDTVDFTSLRICVGVSVGRGVGVSRKFEPSKMSLSAEPGRKTAYSADIAWRVVWRRIGLEQNFTEIASKLQIASSTAHRIFTRFKLTGEVTPKPQPQRPNKRKLDDHHELLIIGIILDNPWREICAIIKDATGVVVSGPTVCRIIRKNGMTRKKVQHVAKQRCLEYRAQFRALSLLYKVEFFVWVDESGSDRRKAMRLFGYSLRGVAPVCIRTLVRGRRISICCDGLVGVELTTGSVDGNKFVDFVRGTLIPNMRPFDGINERSIVIMDNCSIDHVSEVKKLFEDAGILVFYLPPYSPDMSPIEETFSSIKYYLRDHDELMQVTDNPMSIVQAAFDQVTKEQCLAWIKDCGY